jgi:hypothetical protein
MQRLEPSPLLKAFDYFVMHTVEMKRILMHDENMYKSIYHDNNPTVYYKENFLHTFTTSRQSGMTTAAQYVLPKYFNNILYVCNDYRIIKYVKNNWKAFVKDNFDLQFRESRATKHFSPLDLYNKPDNTRGIKIDCICVDCHPNGNQLAEICDLGLSKNALTFIISK